MPRERASSGKKASHRAGLHGYSALVWWGALWGALGARAISVQAASITGLAERLEDCAQLRAASSASHALPFREPAIFVRLLRHVRTVPVRSPTYAGARVPSITWSIFRRSGSRFAVENAIKRTNLDHDSIQFDRVMVSSKGGNAAAARPLAVCGIESPRAHPLHAPRNRPAEAHRRGKFIVTIDRLFRADRKAEPATPAA
jgi:hypothetical protein